MGGFGIFAGLFVLRHCSHFVSGILLRSKKFEHPCLVVWCPARYLKMEVTKKYRWIPIVVCVIIHRYKDLETMWLYGDLRLVNHEMST